MRTLFIAALALIISGCASYGHLDIRLTDFERQVASRMMIGLSRYCDHPPENGGYCPTPMREVHDDIKELIQSTDIGGVILFASNFESVSQAVALTHQLQQAAANQELPLLVAVDQEGGIVIRLPRHVATSFAGNMAIGATYPSHGTYYADQVGQILGKELQVIGVNVNFAPTLDLNTNPDNPVINVRSFGGNPEQAGDLGAALVSSMQQQGVSAALKHFPGHGDTNVDSHTGLPRIDRSLDELMNADLKPFARVIQDSAPAMIMTAHIQYPLIDESTLTGVDGEEVIRPATMSRVILTDLLRKQMNFQGVIVTDALDMKGISSFFDPVQAVVETFRAGSDMALMPFHVDSVDDIAAFKLFIKAVSAQLKQDDPEQMQAAVQRLTNLRAGLSQASLPLPYAIARAEEIVGNSRHRQVEWHLANHAITTIKNDDVLPWKNNRITQLQLVVDDHVQGQLLKDALVEFWPMTNQQPVDISVITWETLESESEHLSASMPRLILMDYGYRNPAAGADVKRLSKDEKLVLVEQLLAHDSESSPVVLLAMQSPYDLMGYQDKASAAIAAYHSKIYIDPVTDEAIGLSYRAIAAQLTGISQFNGVLPVELTDTNNNNKEEVSDGIQ